MVKILDWIYNEEPTSKISLKNYFLMVLVKFWNCFAKLIWQKVSIIKWYQNLILASGSGVFGIPKDDKITCFAFIFQLIGCAKNPTAGGPFSFYHITNAKLPHNFIRTIRKCFFKDVLFLGSCPIIIATINSMAN